VRLQRFLAQAGIASRRRSEEMILEGRVRVNGRTVRQLGSSVTETDRVEFDGRELAAAEPAYLVVHKPMKVMTTMSDPEGRRTVASLFPADGPRVVPVGRLDFDTSGVLFATSDGDLAHVLTHPRYGVEKTYRAIVRGRLDSGSVRNLIDGIRLGGGEHSAPAKIRVVRAMRTESEIDITIHEGRNRQVRRMFEATDHPVLRLVRLRFGPISLGDLPLGQWRPATDREIAQLRVIASDAYAAEAAEAAPS